MTRPHKAPREGSVVLTPFDRRFARALAEMSGEEPSAAVATATALATAAVREGHVCVPLAEHAGKAVPIVDDRRAEQAASEPLPALSSLRRALLACSWVGEGRPPTPLVLDDADRLYLRRYWLHEQEVARQLTHRATTRADDVDRPLLEAGIARLFPERHEEPEWQRVAALTAVLHRLAVISGGPGTGKTSTVVRLLALLVEQQRARGGASLRVKLLAPTGKAAARLTESIRAAKGKLPVDDAVAALIPEEAATLHRALGVVPGSSTRFRHDVERPLLADVVIVDEASMVDLALMRRLLDAVPESARLVLLGDRDQLSSVEAGSVLGDICGRGRRRAGSYSTRFAADALALAGERLAAGKGEPALADSLVELRYSHRFGADGGIGHLARAVQAGDGDAALKLLGEGRDDVTFLAPSDEEGALPRAVLACIVERYRECLAGKDGPELLAALEGFRVLCGHRRGPLGVERLNPVIEQELERAGVIEREHEHYLRRPILVTANDYGTRLFNGDLGVVTSGQDGARAVLFGTADGAGRPLSPSRLPPHETVFAMSVHKSQGSELDEVLVVLPPVGSPLLTRELLYTAVTRARKKVTLVGSEAAVREAIARTAGRSSGLADALWGRAKARPAPLVTT